MTQFDELRIVKLGTGFITELWFKGEIQAKLHDPIDLAPSTVGELMVQIDEITGADYLKDGLQ